MAELSTTDTTAAAERRGLGGLPGIPAPMVTPTSEGCPTRR